MSAPLFQGGANVLTSFYGGMSGEGKCSGRKCPNLVPDRPAGKTGDEGEVCTRVGCLQYGMHGLLCPEDQKLWIVSVGSCPGIMFDLIRSRGFRQIIV